jgi:hypothetical protein
MLSLAVAFLAAFPVNRYLLARGRGHALSHRYHGQVSDRRHIPTPATSTLAAAIVAFMLGGLLVAAAATL